MAEAGPAPERDAARGPRSSRKPRPRPRTPADDGAAAGTTATTNPATAITGKAMVTGPVMSYMLAPRSAAGTFVVGVVEFGEIANMDKRVLSSGR